MQCLSSENPFSSRHKCLSRDGGMRTPFLPVTDPVKISRPCGVLVKDELVLPLITTTHTHTQHTCTHTHAHTHMYMHTHKCTYPYTQCAHAHICSHTHTPHTQHAFLSVRRQVQCHVGLRGGSEIEAVQRSHVVCQHLLSHEEGRTTIGHWI